MNPIPFFYRLFKGSWKEIKNEVNDFAQRRGLNTYDDDPKRYRFHGWGTVHRFIACNAIYLYGSEPDRFDQPGPEAVRSHLLTELHIGWRFIADGVHDGRPLVAIRWIEDGQVRQSERRSLSEAATTINTFAEQNACVYDPWTGLYWLKRGSDRTFVEHGINELREDFDIQPQLTFAGEV